MTIRVGINGFGRIGRNMLRAACNRPEIEIVAVNDLTHAETLVHLLKYDSVHGIWPGKIEKTSNGFVFQGREIKVFSQPEPEKIPWHELEVDVVVEATGLFTSKESAARHQTNGIKKVLITAPAKGADITVVMGVNHHLYDAEKHHIISGASCTTNCLAPVVAVLHREFGIVRGLMTTVHSYTNDQRVLDLPHKDLRRARACGMSIIPTTTGAARAVAEVLPELKGKLNGMAMRVPTPNVSVVDFVAQLQRETTAEAINEALKRASENELKGILDYCSEPLVSRDFNGNPHSSIVDGLSTQVVDGVMAKVVAWYDNEWGYSNRMVDILALIASKGC